MISIEDILLTYDQFTTNIMTSNAIPFALSILVVLVVAYKSWPYLREQRGQNRNTTSNPSITPSGRTEGDTQKGASCSDSVSSPPTNTNTISNKLPSAVPVTNPATKPLMTFNSVCNDPSITSKPVPTSNANSNSNSKRLPNSMNRSRSADSAPLVPLSGPFLLNNGTARNTITNTNSLNTNRMQYPPSTNSTLNFHTNSIAEESAIEGSCYGTGAGTGTGTTTQGMFSLNDSHSTEQYRSSTSTVTPEINRFTPSNPFNNSINTLPDLGSFEDNNNTNVQSNNNHQPKPRSDRRDSITIKKHTKTVVDIVMPGRQTMTITKNTTETTEIPRELIPYNRFIHGLQYAVVEDQGKRVHMENSTSIVDFMNLFSDRNVAQNMSNTNINTNTNHHTSTIPSRAPNPSPPSYHDRNDDHLSHQNCYDESQPHPLSPQHQHQHGKKFGFSVFDGHMGSGCAKFCTDHLPEYVKRLISDGDRDIEEALKLAFHQMDTEWEQEALATQSEAGAVGVFVYLECGFECESDCLYVANVGDCRAILCSKGKVKVLTEEHNGKNQSERARVGEERMPKNSDLLSGHVQVTRAIGDYVTTSTPDSIEGQYTHQKVDGLICDPHIEKHELSPNDEFMIVACDGLWDVMSSENAIKECRRSLRNDGNVRNAAQKLIHSAQRLSNRNCSPVLMQGNDDVAAATSDNISVMVIGFAKQDKTIVEPLPTMLGMGSRLRRRRKLKKSGSSPQ